MLKCFFLRHVLYRVADIQMRITSFHERIYNTIIYARVIFYLLPPKVVRKNSELNVIDLYLRSIFAWYSIVNLMSFADTQYA